MINNSKERTLSGSALDVGAPDKWALLRNKEKRGRKRSEERKRKKREKEKEKENGKAETR